MSQLTLDGARIPIKKGPERKLTPGSIHSKIMNFLKGQYKPLSEDSIKKQIVFKGHTIGNRLRELRKWGYVEDIKQKKGPQLWRAK